MFALLLPEGGRWAERHGREKLTVLRMEFKTFLNAFMRVAAQVVRTGRRIAFRLLSWNPWQDDDAAHQAPGVDPFLYSPVAASRLTSSRNTLVLGLERGKIAARRTRPPTGL
jgi:hypothetical protein